MAIDMRRQEMEMSTHSECCEANSTSKCTTTPITRTAVKGRTRHQLLHGDSSSKNTSLPPGSGITSVGGSTSSSGPGAGGLPSTTCLSSSTGYSDKFESRKNCVTAQQLQFSPMGSIRQASSMSSAERDYNFSIWENNRDSVTNKMTSNKRNTEDALVASPSLLRDAKGLESPLLDTTPSRSFASEILSSDDKRKNAIVLSYLAFQTISIGAPQYGFISALGKLSLPPTEADAAASAIPTYTETAFLIMLRSSQLGAFPVATLVDRVGGKIGTLIATLLFAIGGISLAVAVHSAGLLWADSPDPGMQMHLVVAGVSYGLAATFQIVSVMLTLRTVFPAVSSDFSVTLMNGCYDSSSFMFTLVGLLSTLGGEVAASASSSTSTTSVEQDTGGTSDHIRPTHAAGDTFPDGTSNLLKQEHADRFALALVAYAAFGLLHFVFVFFFYPDRLVPSTSDATAEEDAAVVVKETTRMKTPDVHVHPHMEVPTIKITTTASPDRQHCKEVHPLLPPVDLSIPLLGGDISKAASDFFYSAPPMAERAGEEDVALDEIRLHCKEDLDGVNVQPSPTTSNPKADSHSHTRSSFWRMLRRPRYLFSILWFAAQFQNFTGYLTQMPDILDPYTLELSGWLYPVSLLTALLMGTIFNKLQNPGYVVAIATVLGIAFQLTVLALSSPDPPATSTRTTTETTLGGALSQSLISFIRERQVGILFLLPLYRSGLFSAMWIYWPVAFPTECHHLGSMYGFASLFAFLFSSFLIAFVLPSTSDSASGDYDPALGEYANLLWVALYGTISVSYTLYLLVPRRGWTIIDDAN
ncbi:unnamed protein product [Amoebophrya sp. A25]|nr:unnamed protein product [Amoebophrya sp. A25]|eukprot:GSA25T00009542001.1